ncbi:MAG: lipopolysaccharide biosynthesis protein RfbH [Candidatus Micrarchaeota archaeon]
MDEKEKLKKEILEMVSKYYSLAHAKKEFTPGKTRINYAGRVFDEKEMVAAADSLLDFYLTLGKNGKEFEEKLSKFLGLSHSVLTNSGSSANLLAVSALCSLQYPNRLLPGDEVITAAAGFPTTVNPILQNNLVPVFVDSEIGSYNIDASKIEEAISKKTKAIMFAHTLGNPGDMDEIMRIAKKHGLIVIEDCCDALGSAFDGKLLGTFGSLATFSFYPAHHITMGEGGAISGNSKLLDKILRSLRDWGRSCWCDPGKSNTCGVRFEFKIAGVPYDHKYMYDNIGYNLKPLDLQAAIGVKQLDKLPIFVEKRKENFKMLFKEFKKFDEFLTLPTWHKKADPAWFGFPITIKPHTGIKLIELQKFLEDNLIESRRLFSGNITKQPAYRESKFRVSGKLENSDLIMANTLFLGVYPGINKEMINYTVDKFSEFLHK